MKKRSLLILLGLLPVLATAHPLPIEHSHNGILNGWEGVVVIVFALAIAVIIARRIWKPLKG